MSYKLSFLESVLKEWQSLDHPLKIQFKKKLAERLVNPRVGKDRVWSVENVYKIKLWRLGYRLVYQVIDERVVVQVIVIGRRDKNFVYKVIKGRL